MVKHDTAVIDVGHSLRRTITNASNVRETVKENITGSTNDLNRRTRAFSDRSLPQTVLRRSSNDSENAVDDSTKTTIIVVVILLCCITVVGLWFGIKSKRKQKNDEEI